MSLRQFIKDVTDHSRMMHNQYQRGRGPRQVFNPPELANPESTCGCNICDEGKFLFKRKEGQPYTDPWGIKWVICPSCKGRDK